MEWLTETVVFWLNRWALLDLIKILGALSVVVVAWHYITGANERTTAKHYQAWQVINLAHGKGGSGGRVEALQEEKKILEELHDLSSKEKKQLNKDHVAALDKAERAFRNQLQQTESALQSATV